MQIWKYLNIGQRNTTLQTSITPFFYTVKYYISDSYACLKCWNCDHEQRRRAPAVTGGGQVLSCAALRNGWLQQVSLCLPCSITPPRLAAWPALIKCVDSRDFIGKLPNMSFLIIELMTFQIAFISYKINRALFFSSSFPLHFSYTWDGNMDFYLHVRC